MTHFATHTPTVFGLSSIDILSAVARVRSPDDSVDPFETFARIAGSVLTEPGDSLWGQLVSLTSARDVLNALVDTPSVTSFAERFGDVGLDPGELDAAWTRWSPRLQSRRVLDACAHAVTVTARVIHSHDPEWPTGLDDLGPFAPAVLYARGVLELSAWSPSVAIVGARAASGYGEHVAAELSAELASSGWLVVSGGAYGIDGIAHRAALSSDAPSVAFLAGGIDRLYPSGNRDLLQQLTRHGLVLAETPCGTAPTKWRFLQRNRLIAASAGATVVVEAGTRSGSLNTAGHAAALGRPLGAVPGPITSPSSNGCHRLLREYDARCITSAADVREMVWGSDSECDWMSQHETAEHVRVRDALGTRPHSVEDIALRAGMSLADVSGVLMMLEMTGHAQAGPHGWTRARST